MATKKTVVKRNATRKNGNDNIAELFGLLCDVIERAWQHLPVDSYKEHVLRHTSEYARAAPARILDALEVRLLLFEE